MIVLETPAGNLQFHHMNPPKMRHEVLSPQHREVLQDQTHVQLMCLIQSNLDPTVTQQILLFDLLFVGQ